MSYLTLRTSELENLIIRIYATIQEGFTRITKSGWALARIVKDRAKLEFLGDQPLIFRPGMPVTVHVS